MMMNVHKIELG